MDYALAEVVTAVHHGSSTDAQRWFTLVCDEYRDLDNSGAGDDWDQFVQRLTSRADTESFSGDPAEVAQSVIAAASERIRAQLLSEAPDADRLPPEQLQQIIDGALAG
ncbi:hypothetical protein L6E12_29275 [Actinokineospora sp. PR83]|uniref:hypothetical protein n=1 Tax=Actinokineospora sp. PR83 TaxID=2884908 RepID=UPI001F1D80DB|nr:hypothetical protein [Actinokineospora sp. PR83]MCG8919868.1 hypothetical protein [Actinokineospora sp. PR83]